VDLHNSDRELYSIAELGKPAGTPTSSPKVMKISFHAAGIKPPEGITDFRTEILGAGRFFAEIYVTDVFNKSKVPTLTGRTETLEVKDKNWRPIGRIDFDEAVASHACDFRLHFHHSPWRKNPDQPGSEKEGLRSR